MTAKDAIEIPETGERLDVSCTSRETGGESPVVEGWCRRAGIDPRRTRNPAARSRNERTAPWRREETR